MTLIEKHSGRFAYLLVVGISQLALGVWFYYNDQKWLLFLWMPLGISTLARAFDVRKQVWTFNRENNRYEVIRNNKLLFSGTVDDLLAITADSKSYVVYPNEGKNLMVPRSIAVDFMKGFYQDYRAKKQAELEL